MHQKRRGLALSALVAGLSLTLAACGGGDGGSDGDTNADNGGTERKQGGTFRLGITEPVAIDPYNAQESEGILVTKQLFKGLVDINEDAEIVPGVAEEWEANDDCTQWTFTLREGTKFSNGETVTAKSFVDGWTRAALKGAASDVAYHMAGIQGFSDINEGTATTLSGVTATDDTTLDVTLAEPDCEFDKKTLQPVYSPVPSTAGAANNKAYNEEPIGNGPFKMNGPWQHNSKISLVRNDEYYGEPAALDGVEISILNPENAQTLEYNGFKGGQFDFARIPPTLLEQAKAQYEPQGSFIESSQFGINTLLPITDAPPFDNPDARKAVSLAIDRDAIISGVFKGFQIKATSLLPPRFEAYYQEGVCETCESQDVEEAKRLAMSSGLVPGTKFDLKYNTGAGHDEWVQAVAAQLEEVLGVDVNIVGMPFPELLAAQQAPGQSGLFRFAWGADYPTPDNFLFPLLSTKSINKDETGKVTGDNRARYSNPEFDDLLTQARAAKSEEERVPLIQQAEEIAIGQDQAMIPLWYRSQYRVYNSDMYQGVRLDFFENPSLEDASLK